MVSVCSTGTPVGRSCSSSDSTVTSYVLYVVFVPKAAPILRASLLRFYYLIPHGGARALGADGSPIVPV